MRPAKTFSFVGMKTTTSRVPVPAALRDAGERRADHREPGLDPGVAVVDDLAAVDGVRMVRQSSPS